MRLFSMCHVNVTSTAGVCSYASFTQPSRPRVGKPCMFADAAVGDSQHATITYTCPNSSRHLPRSLAGPPQGKRDPHSLHPSVLKMHLKICGRRAHPVAEQCTHKTSLMQTRKHAPAAVARSRQLKAHPTQPPPQGQAPPARRALVGSPAAEARAPAGP